jgi:hypothetical protein
MQHSKRRERIPAGKPWDRQPVSGKLRPKLGVSPGFATCIRLKTGRAEGTQRGWHAQYAASDLLNQL